MSEFCTIEAPSGPPGLADTAARLHLAASDLEPNFGVVLIDPPQHLYADSALTDSGAHRHPSVPGVSGPFANRRIDPFGPPRS